MDAHVAEALRLSPAADVPLGLSASASDTLRFARRAAVVIALFGLCAATGWTASGRIHGGFDAAVAPDVIEQTNAIRANAGLPPLSANPQLTQAADAYAGEMARRGWLAHTTSDGAGVESRAEAAGYVDWAYLAENLATGPGAPAADALITSWLNSPGHRRNILSPDLREIGVGCYVAGARYWCAQEFGARER